MLEIREVTKRYSASRSDPAGVLAVDNVSLEVHQGELFTLLGPSGCGKTTTLRSIAGLEYPDSGVIRINGKDLFNSSTGVTVPSNERGLGMVFQSYAIWPHMNVFGNVAFPLTVKARAERLKRHEIQERVERVLDVVQLSSMKGRPATDLSGGQQQRLALARALVMEPPVLLLDEPLSNLDAKLREGMRNELKRLQRSLGITALYVTHDQVEALSMSSRIAVMNGGIVEQLGTPREIYSRPQTKFVADFIGASDFLLGKVLHRVGERAAVETPIGVIQVPISESFSVNADVTVCVRPEHVNVEEIGEGEDASTATFWIGTIEARTFLGETVEHVVGIGGHTIRSRTNPSKSIHPGTPVSVHIDGDWCSLIPR